MREDSGEAEALPAENDFYGRMRERIMQAKKMSTHGRQQGDPLVYGFTLSFKGEKPVFEEFGNTRFSPEGLPIREPMTDVLTGRSHVSVIMELPGAGQEDIELNATDRKLKLHVDMQKIIFEKEVDLGVDIDPDSVDATLKNGILEIHMRRL
mgnify:CR=1 FL=1